jgi:hypothetical protein
MAVGQLLFLKEQIKDIIIICGFGSLSYTSARTSIERQKKRERGREGERGEGGEGGKERARE